MIHETIKRAVQQWHTVRAQLDTDALMDLAIAIQQIPAPTFDEGDRASFVVDQFTSLGLENVSRDELHNVYGWLNHGDHHRVILVSAHLDTVFPRETDLSIRRQRSRVYGPGLGDNSLGVAALLSLAQAFRQHPLPDDIAICFVANSREEGLGNLDGIRQAVDTLSAERISAAIVIEGLALGHIYHGGIAVRRLKINTKAEGGHSWLSFGKASAVHGLVQISADISRLGVPSEPRTTYNIGLIGGGHSVNSIATDAHCYLDLRSVSATALANLEAQVRATVSPYATPELGIDIEVVGDRPAGAIPANSPLVQLGLGALSKIGLNGILEYGSTDANVLLAKNIPAIVAGISHGGNAHRLDEFVETALLRDGMWQLMLLLAATIDWYA